MINILPLNNLTAESFTARLAKANFASKSDITNLADIAKL